MTKCVKIGGNGLAEVVFGADRPLSIIAGTCAIEGREITLKTAETVKKIAEKLGIGLVYKGSFDKANRTSAKGPRGIGLEKGLEVLAEVRRELGLPVVTDVHEVVQVAPVAKVVDVLQIPAFLARQTDLVFACGEAVAGQAGKAVNIKKGQFMAPADMGPAAAKAAAGGTEAIMLTERGTTFGYGDLVVDMRSFGIMAATGYPVIFDVTHSVMQPSGRGESSGGNRAYAPPLARAAVGAGVAGLFIETHPDPANAFSDKETQLPLDTLEAFLRPLVEIDKLVKGF
jgi:2-dehydro-3-deoxyphosphooctonate aldolase (KDO 8-P synthase)